MPAGRASLVEEARRRAPELAAAAAGDDALRRLSGETWKQLLEGRFLRALQPARWGGGEVSLLEFIDTSIEPSRRRRPPPAGWPA